MSYFSSSNITSACYPKHEFKNVCQSATNSKQKALPRFRNCPKQIKKAYGTHKNMSEVVGDWQLILRHSLLTLKTIFFL